MLPNDINMLVSMLNMKLRDDDMALETVIEVNDGNVKEIMDKLEYKVCEVCGQEKHILEFSKSYPRRCKACDP